MAGSLIFQVVQAE